MEPKKFHENYEDFSTINSWIFNGIILDYWSHLLFHLKNLEQKFEKNSLMSLLILISSQNKKS